MEYIDLCKYVFSEERVDWELRSLKNRRRPLVMARHIAIYLGNWFWPMMTDEELINPFSQDRCTVFHALSHIKNLLYSDKDLRRRIDKYLIICGKQIKEDNSIESMNRDIERAIENMQIVADVYCKLTGMKLVKDN